MPGTYLGQSHVLRHKIILDGNKLPCTSYQLWTSTWCTIIGSLNTNPESNLDHSYVDPVCDTDQDLDLPQVPRHAADFVDNKASTYQILQSSCILGLG